MDNKYLFIGDDVSKLKIYEIINSFFGKDYAGWMKAWFDINDDFAAWFPTITETDEKPDGIFGGTRNCSNTLSLDGCTINEIDHDDMTSTIFDSRFDKHRLVFARLNGKFKFLGVFKRTIVHENGKTIKQHIKCADGINLMNFEMYRRVDYEILNSGTERPLQLPIRAKRFRYLTNEYKPKADDAWVMECHNDHFLIYNTKYKKYFFDAYFYVCNDDRNKDNDIKAVVYKYRYNKEELEQLNEEDGFRLLVELISGIL